ncbi:MAG: PLP-dependent aminotransferase family protein [Verrucomicrobiota bacterium]
MRQVNNENLINLAAGVPAASLLPVEDLSKCYRRVVKVSDGACYAYELPEGDPGLRTELAQRLENRNVTLPQKEGDVLLTIGCTQALRLALELTVKPGDLVACESPCYYNLLEQIESLGAKALPIPTDINDGVTPEALEPLLNRYGPKSLVVCSSLSNPTGATIPLENRSRLVELCRKYDVNLIEDDIYAELRDEGALPPLRSFDDGSQVLYVSSYCKSVAPGLRVGVFLPGPFWEEAAQKRCMEIMHGSTLAEGILREYLKSKLIDKHLEEMKKICYRRRSIVRNAVEAYFPKNTLVSNPQGGFLLWAVLPTWICLEEAAQASLSKGVSFARGEVFLTGKPKQACMRLNCAKASEDELAKGIEILGKILKQRS